MTDILIARRAYIEMAIDCDEWKLPGIYDDALEPYIDSIPTTFYLPWSPMMLPSKGQRIIFPGIIISFDTLIASDISYEYSSQTGIIAHIEAILNGHSRDFDVAALYGFATEGFLIENMTKTIRQVLEEANLWTELNEMMNKLR